MIKIISILVALAVLVTLAGTASAQDTIMGNNIAYDNFVATNINAAAAAPLLGTAAADSSPTVGQQSSRIGCMKNICMSAISIQELNQCNGIVEQVSTVTETYNYPWIVVLEP